MFHAFPNYIQLIGPALLNLECGGKVLRDAAFLPDRDSITSQSGVAEYLASALQIKTPLSASTGSALAGDVLSSRRLSGAAQMDASITAALTLGFVLGLRHALDPDHLVAVSTIVSEHKSVARSSLVGTFWGLGHTSSLLAISLVILLLRTSIPEHASLWMELPVALMLMVLGLNALWRTLQERGWQVHTHVHRHDQGEPHSHIHLHAHDEHKHRHHLFRVGRGPFLVGLVHGVAGSAAITLAVVATIPSIGLGLIWIAVFGIGSIGGMLLMSAMIGLPFALTARRFSILNGGIRLLAGLFSVLFGLWLAWGLVHEISKVSV